MEPLKHFKVKLDGTESDAEEYRNYSRSDVAFFFWIQIPQCLKAAKRTFSSKLVGTGIWRLGLLEDLNE